MRNNNDKILEAWGGAEERPRRLIFIKKRFEKIIFHVFPCSSMNDSVGHSCGHSSTVEYLSNMSLCAVCPSIMVLMPELTL